MKRKAIREKERKWLTKRKTRKHGVPSGLKSMPRARNERERREVLKPKEKL
jgi:hypothetical protein